jgi:putative transposase
MQKFSISYTKAINTRFSRVGSLFQGQFQAKLVRNHSHLLNLCVYIHANPVKDGLVALPEDWIYSNYLDWLGQRDGTLVDREFVQEHFGSPGEYRKLVMQFVKTRYLPEDMRKYFEAFE